MPDTNTTTTNEATIEDLLAEAGITLGNARIEDPAWSKATRALLTNEASTVYVFAANTNEATLAVFAKIGQKTGAVVIHASESKYSQLSNIVNRLKTKNVNVVKTPLKGFVNDVETNVGLRIVRKAS